MSLPTLNKNIAINNKIASLQKPNKEDLHLPEKVLQFGTGVLLRGLPDYYIDKANKQGIFNGRIVVVKSTGNGISDEFSKQDNLFTHCIKGYANNQFIEETIINASISRVLSVKTEWSSILNTANDQNVQLIISNTTEVGIVLDENDLISNNPPNSFPGKLLAWLYQRYQYFNGNYDAGVVIIPTELVTDNATKLKLILKQLSAINKLENTFIDWLFNANDFCNSLVDRIVPGKMPLEQHNATLNDLGYNDDLMIMSEVYSLWAIETSSERTKSILSFAQVNDGIILAPTINKFRELKLRLLNGTHTFSCGLAYLMGFETVKDAMNNKLFSSYVHDLILYEIAACIESEEISRTVAHEFSKGVIDRFRNPSIDHRWLSITMNYTGKMQMRNVPLIIAHYNRFETVPNYMAAGFAAYLLFMKVVKFEDEKYYGIRKGESYFVNDVAAAYFFNVWQNSSVSDVVTKALSNKEMWGTDLTALTGFASAVLHYLNLFIEGAFIETLDHLEKNKLEVEV